MPRTTKEEARRIRFCVLGYIARRVKSGHECPCCLSYREISRALGFSVDRVRHTCRMLADDQLINPQPSFGEDGGQRANAYLITRKGWQQVHRENCLTLDHTGK